MSDVTRLLDAAAAGDHQAAADLLPLVYDELRKLAAARLAADDPAHAELLGQLQAKLRAFQKQTGDPWLLKWDRE